MRRFFKRACMCCSWLFLSGRDGRHRHRKSDDRGSGSSSPGLVRLQTQGVHRARHQRSGHLEHHAAPFPLIRKRAVEDIVESAEPGGKSGELHDALHSARHVEIGGRPFIPAHFRVGRAGNFRRPCPDACSTACGGKAGTAGCGLIWMIDGVIIHYGDYRADDSQWQR